MKIAAFHRRAKGEAHAARGAFTLVEMLVVMAIIAILAVLALPAVKGMLGSMDLKGAANIVTAQLDLARQTASTRNVQTDVRIYQDPNVTDPNAGGANAYRIIAVVIPAAASGAAADEFVSPGLALPGDIVFDQSTTYSTLLNPALFDDSAHTVTRTTAVEATTAPTQLQGKTYMKLSYLPGGTAYLENDTTTTGTWCLSLRNVHAKAAASAPASNFISIVVDPSTSRFRVYQP